LVRRFVDRMPTLGEKMLTDFRFGVGVILGVSPVSLIVNFEAGRGGVAVLEHVLSDPDELRRESLLRIRQSACVRSPHWAMRFS
jgi:hypothetical protein